MRFSTPLIATLFLASPLVAASVSYSGTLDRVNNAQTNFSNATPVWFLTFTVTAGTRMVFDVLAAEKDAYAPGPVTADFNGDNQLTFIDSQIELFNASWSRIALNDDHGAYRSAADGNGSIYRYDSYLDYTFASAGRYWLALTTWQPTSTNVQRGYENLQSWNTNGADWRIDVTTVSGAVVRPALSPYQPAPEPATLGLIGLAVGGAAWWRRRRPALAV
jgi:hypothetical protein